MIVSDLSQLVIDVAGSTALLRRIANGVCELVGEVSVSAILRPHEGALVTVCATGFAEERVGLSAPLEGTMAGLAFTSGELIVSNEVAGDPRVTATVRRHPTMQSLLAMPLVEDGRTVGVLSLGSTTPATLTAERRARLAAVSGFIATALAAVTELGARMEGTLAGFPAARGRTPDELGDGDAERIGAFLLDVLEPGQSQRLRARREIADVIDAGRLETVMQPIVDLDTGETVAAEALSRFPDLPGRGPDVVFAQARLGGLGLELEELAVRRALASRREMPPELTLGVNISYEMLVSDRLAALFDGVAAGALAVELTEHAAFDDYAWARQAISALRTRGILVSVDDVGAGYASFRHVLELGPDSIKLDRFFTAGIEHDPRRRAIAEDFAGLARSLGIRLIAEGIETESELDAIRALGVRYGQGYLIARPGPPPELAERYPAVARRGVPAVK